MRLIIYTLSDKIDHNISENVLIVGIVLFLLLSSLLVLFLALFNNVTLSSSKYYKGKDIKKTITHLTTSPPEMPQPEEGESWYDYLIRKKIFYYIILASGLCILWYTLGISGFVPSFKILWVWVKAGGVKRGEGNSTPLLNLHRRCGYFIYKRTKGTQWVSFLHAKDCAASWYDQVWRNRRS